MKDAKSCSSIDEIRHAIDSVDRKVMELLAKRQEYVYEIIRFKTNEESIVAQGRQEQLYEQRRAWAQELKLSPEMIEDVYKTMIHHYIQKELELHKQAKI